MQCCNVIATAATRRRQRVVERAHLLAEGENQIDACFGERLRQRGVEAPGVGAELEHVAEYRDTVAARVGLGAAEHGEGRAHRGGAGIVAFIDQREAAARDGDCGDAGPRPASGACVASAAAAAPRSAPTAQTAASTARLFITQCRPGRPSV